MSSFGTVTIAERSSRPRHDLAELIALEHGWGLRVEPITRSQRGDLGPVLSSGQFDVAISINKARWTSDISRDGFLFSFSCLPTLARSYK
ncbi:hypothetical protein TNCT_293821 [Trichonephila clavata]|uniref:Uncharacterized protein n=1 Tax=Trichonephila clavata TaxID=2740835 RepID=A0A8X6FPS4_TRICU|nr:hypothetical protein TNCT_293821 [Trichonephila clavata]